MIFKTESLELDIRLPDITEIGTFYKKIGFDLGNLRDEEFVKENNHIIYGGILKCMFDMKLIVKVSGKASTPEELKADYTLFPEMSNVAVDYLSKLLIPEKKTT